MIVTFCGHSKFSASMEYERKILSFLEEWVGDNVAEMYLGGYGEFDGFAYTCCKNTKSVRRCTSVQKRTLLFFSYYSSGTSIPFSRQSL